MEICSPVNRALKSLMCVMLLYGPFSACLIITVPLTVKYEKILLFQRFLHSFHNPLQYGHRLLFTYILVPSGKLRFVGLRSFSLFLIHIKCWLYFLRENLTVVRSDFVSRWHASILSFLMSKPMLLKNLHTVCSKSFDSTVLGIPITSTHSRREYWPFTQHCLSVISSCFRRLLFTVFTIQTSDSSLLKLLLKAFISAIKETIVEFF